MFDSQHAFLEQSYNKVHVNSSRLISFTFKNEIHLGVNVFAQNLKGEVKIIHLKNTRHLIKMLRRQNTVVI